MLKLFAYIVFVLWFNMICVLNVTTSNVQRHLHHHHHHHRTHYNHERAQQQIQRKQEQRLPIEQYSEKSNHNNNHHHHRHNNNSNLHNRIDFYYGSLSRTWNTHNKYNNISYNNGGGYNNNNHIIDDIRQNQVPNENTINASSTATTALPILPMMMKTTKMTSKPLTNPLKLTLIHTNGNSFVSNNYPHAFNRHFYRWPIATTTSTLSLSADPNQQQPTSTLQPLLLHHHQHHHHTDFDIKWRIANNNNNNAYVPNFNPTIDSIPIVPTVKINTNTRRAFADEPNRTKHHTGPGYVFILFLFKTLLFSMLFNIFVSAFTVLFFSYFNFRLHSTLCIEWMCHFYRKTLRFQFIVKTILFCTLYFIKQHSHIKKKTNFQWKLSSK